MRTPPNGKQGKLGTQQKTKAANESANDDRRTREIIARRVRSDAPYTGILCTDDALPLCAEDRRIARIETGKPGDIAAFVNRALQSERESGRDDWGVDGSPRD